MSNNQLTNEKLAQDKGCTSRQISKSRKRGWIWLYGERTNYKAPEPARIEPGKSWKTTPFVIKKEKY
jgi:hypothetical protein